MENLPLISVIIPVYNVSAYLDECVNSVMEQTYQNLEIILVDDGSPDDCPQKCDDYAAKDSRIKVIHQANGGQSVARNAALDICRGSYINFIDSDDVVAEDYIEVLYKTLIDYKVEISICHYQRFDTRPPSHAEIGTATIYSAHDAVKIALQGKPFTIMPVAKLYSRRVFQELRFPQGMIYEDLAFIWKVIAQVENVAYISAIKYYYRQNPHSTTNMSFSHKNLDIITAYQKILSEISQYFPDLTFYVRGRFGCAATWWLYRALQCSFLDEEALKRLQSVVKQNLLAVFLDKNTWKVKLFALSISSTLIFRLILKLKSIGASNVGD